MNAAGKTARGQKLFLALPLCQLAFLRRRSICVPVVPRRNGHVSQTGIAEPPFDGATAQRVVTVPKHSIRRTHFWCKHGFVLHCM